MDKAQKVERLYAIYADLYEAEDEDNYDLDSAWLYWTSLPLAELESELAEAEQKMSAHTS